MSYATVEDLSGNGMGVLLTGKDQTNTIDLSLGDVAINNAEYIRVGVGGVLKLRSPAALADVTINALSGEYVPIGNGTIVRQIGTTATELHSIGV